MSDDFLTKLYEEEQEKVASADLQGFMDTLSVDELAAYLGLDKTAGIPGPDEAPMPSGVKGSEVFDRAEKRKQRGAEAQAEADKAAKEAEPKEKESGSGCMKYASADWADQMGRFLAQDIEKEAKVKRLMRIGKSLQKSHGMTPGSVKVLPTSEKGKQLLEAGRTAEKAMRRRMGRYPGGTEAYAKRIGIERSRVGGPEGAMKAVSAGPQVKTSGIASLVAKGIKGVGPKGLKLTMGQRAASMARAVKPRAGLAAQMAAKRSPAQSAAARLTQKARSVARPAAQRVGNLLRRI